MMDLLQKAKYIPPDLNDRLTPGFTFEVSMLLQGGNLFAMVLCPLCGVQVKTPKRHNRKWDLFNFRRHFVGHSELEEYKTKPRASKNQKASKNMSEAEAEAEESESVGARVGELSGVLHQTLDNTSNETSGSDKSSESLDETSTGSNLNDPNNNPLNLALDHRNTELETND